MLLKSIVVAFILAQCESYPTFIHHFPGGYSEGFLSNCRPLMPPWSPFGPPIFDSMFAPHLRMPSAPRRLIMRFGPIHGIVCAKRLDLMGNSTDKVEPTISETSKEFISTPTPINTETKTTETSSIKTLPSEEQCLKETLESMVPALLKSVFAPPVENNEVKINSETVEEHIHTPEPTAEKIEENAVRLSSEEVKSDNINKQTKSESLLAEMKSLQDSLTAIQDELREGIRMLSSTPQQESDVQSQIEAPKNYSDDTESPVPDPQTISSKILERFDRTLGEIQKAAPTTPQWSKIEETVDTSVPNSRENMINSDIVPQ